MKTPNTPHVTDGVETPNGGSLHPVVSLADVTPDGRYVIRVTCRDCKAELNSTTVMTGNQVLSNWGKLVISSGLVTKSCPNGCRATWSDCNINTDMTITQEANR